MPEFGEDPSGDVIPDFDEHDDGGHSRRRAALTLGGIALGAVVVVLLMVALVRTPNHRNHAVAVGSATGASSVTTVSAPSPTSRPPASTPAPAPSSTASSTTCSAPPCVLSGDPGDVVAAITAYRVAQGQPLVTGAATDAAGSCAAHSGDRPSCSTAYYWMPVPAVAGAAVVNKIANYAGGRTWLLSTRLTTVAVGWAEISPTQFACAVYDLSSTAATSPTSTG